MQTLPIYKLGFLDLSEIVLTIRYKQKWFPLKNSVIISLSTTKRLKMSLMLEGCQLEGIKSPPYRVNLKLLGRWMLNLYTLMSKVKNVARKSKLHSKCVT